MATDETQATFAAKTFGWCHSCLNYDSVLVVLVFELAAVTEKPRHSSSCFPLFFGGGLSFFTFIKTMMRVATLTRMPNTDTNSSRRIR